MIDKIIYKFFEMIDDFFNWVEEIFIIHNKKCKCPICKSKRKK